MGIDARMVLRKVRSEDVNDDRLLEWSMDLCRACGPSNFFIRHDDARVPVNARHAISRTGTRWREEGDPMPGRVYRQDGPDVIAEIGECLLQVHLFDRYYGVGYERGDLLTQCGIAEACEVIVPGCEVWYGGDSSGVLLHPWPDEVRRDLRRHLYSPQGRDYFKESDLLKGSSARRGEEWEPPRCALCASTPMERFGYGNGYGAYSCLSCGQRLMTKDAGMTWMVFEEKM